MIPELRAMVLAAMALVTLYAPAEAIAQSDQSFQGEQVQEANQSAAQPEASPSPAPTYPEIIPHFGQGVASATDVSRLVGPTRVTFESCPTEFYVGNHRRVQLHIGEPLRQSLFDTPAVADALLAKVARATWAACPQPYNEERTDFHYNIESIQILDADDSVALSAGLGKPGIDANSDDLFKSSHYGYAWVDVTDGYSDHQEKIANDNANTAYEAAQNVVREQRNAQYQSDLASFGAGFWRILKFITGISVAIWLFNRRQVIAEWFYALTPHPSSTQVDNAIRRGLPIDGRLFAAVNQPFDGNKYEINVRNRQADALTQRLRRHEAALGTQSEAILRRKRDEVLREQEFLRAHEALINAGIDHEVAAAHLDALRKATRQ